LPSDELLENPNEKHSVIFLLKKEKPDMALFKFQDDPIEAILNCFTLLLFPSEISYLAPQESKTDIYYLYKIFIAQAKDFL
jgi:hypothetical protein